MSRRLEGKVAIVTGGGTGIGEAIAKLFVREGAKVAVVGLPDDPIGEVAEEIGDAAIAIAANVADPAAAKMVVQKTIDAFGKLDVLINDAGVLPKASPMSDLPESEFERVIDSNIRSTYYMTREALPELEKSRGNVVSASSEAAYIGEPQIVAYAGTKGFVAAFTRTLAMELTPKGIRINAIAPGPIDTEMTDPKFGKINDEFAKDNAKGTPMGRVGTPQEVANAYLFLASDEASYITGTVLHVDGGSVVGKGNLGEKVPDEIKQAPEITLDLRHQKVKDSDDPQI